MTKPLSCMCGKPGSVTDVLIGYDFLGCLGMSQGEMINSWEISMSHVVTCGIDRSRSPGGELLMEISVRNRQVKKFETWILNSNFVHYPSTIQDLPMQIDRFISRASRLWGSFSVATSDVNIFLKPRVELLARSQCKRSGSKSTAATPLGTTYT